MEKTDNIMPGTIYTEDILRNGFEQRVIPLRNDYQGYAVATLIRKKAQQNSAKAVFYLHGFNDYFFQTEMADRFNSRGYNFYAVDLRKYGRSYLPHQKFNDIRNLKAYYEEILASLTIIRTEGNAETILLGHSTGGLILTLFAKDHPDSDLYDGLMLNSPFFDFNLSPLTKKLLPIVSFIGKFIPNITVSGGFSEKYGESIHKDYFGEWNYNLKWKPNVPPKVNLGWIRAVKKAQNQLKRSFHILKPVLIMHSGKSVIDINDQQQVTTCDAILNVNDIKRIARNIKGSTETVAIDGGLHDLILSQKQAREEVYAAMFSWLSKNKL